MFLLCQSHPAVLRVPLADRDVVNCSAGRTQVIECNLRASRTFPFISKTLDCNFITLATRVMLGVKAVPYNISLLDIDYVAVKVCVCIRMYVPAFSSWFCGRKCIPAALCRVQQYIVWILFFFVVS